MNNVSYLYENYSKESDDIVDFIITHKFPKYEEFEWSKPYNYEGECLVHNTTFSNLGGIIKEGLTLSSNRSNSFTWAVNLGEIKSKHWSKKWEGCGGCSIIFKTYPKYVEPMNSNQYGIMKEITPSEIISIDIPFIDGLGETHRLSEMREIVLEDYSFKEIKDCYGTDEFIPSYLTKEQFIKLWDFLEENI